MLSLLSLAIGGSFLRGIHVQHRTDRFFPFGELPFAGGGGHLELESLIDGFSRT
jgi:hypothetical protein